MFVLTQSGNIWDRWWSYIWRNKKHALFLFQMVVGFLNVFEDSPWWWVAWCATYIRVQAKESKLWSYCGLVLSSSDRGGWSLLPSQPACELRHVLLCPLSAFLGIVSESLASHIIWLLQTSVCKMSDASFLFMLCF